MIQRFSAMLETTVKTPDERTLLLKSGCPVCHNWTKENYTSCIAYVLFSMHTFYLT